MYHFLLPKFFKWPYQANVMKRLEKTNSSAVRKNIDIRLSHLGYIRFYVSDRRFPPESGRRPALHYTHEDRFNFKPFLKNRREHKEKLCALDDKPTNYFLRV